MKNKFVFFPRFVKVDALNGGFFIKKNVSDQYEPAFKLLPGVYIVSDYYIDENNVIKKESKDDP